MPELDFRIEGAEVERYAATPLIRLRLRVSSPEPAIRIRNVMLQCQIRIEATRRLYTAAEQARLRELFGPPQDWGHTLRSLLWTHVNVTVPAFERECVVDLPVPCSYDFTLAIAKYFHGLDDGEVPLLLLFSGTVFYADEAGVLQLGQIAWSKEAGYRLPVRVLQEMTEHYYPDGAWLRLSRDVFERVLEYKRAGGFLTFEQALGSLLDAAEGAGRMNLARAEAVVRAVLYEGYILYPYRASAIKNRQRWTFGGLFPEAYGGGDPCRMRTECLLQGGPETSLEVRVRFLQLVDRQVGRLDQPWSGTASRRSRRSRRSRSAASGI